MVRYIKYKRFVKQIQNEDDLQTYLDELIRDGWEIINYHELPNNKIKENPDIICVVCGKVRNNLI